MMQRTGTRAQQRRVLIVDQSFAETGGAAARSVRALADELRSRNIEVLESNSCEDGLATAVSDSAIHCIMLNWSSGPREQATELLRAVRARNAKIPIFLMASRKFAGTVSVEVATLSDEFVWILDDTAAFIGGRVEAAIERYIQILLPPFTAALARYDR